MDEPGKLSRSYKVRPPTDATQWRPYLGMQLGQHAVLPLP